MCVATGGGQSHYRTSWQPAGTNQWGGQSYMKVNYPRKGPKSTPGWTANTAGGYDLGREMDVGNTIANLAIPSIKPAGAATLQTAYLNREYGRGYDPFGRWIGQPYGSGGTGETTDATPTPEAAPPTQPEYPWEDWALSIPDPPPPNRAYAQGGGGKNKQLRAKRANRANLLEGKRGLMIPLGVNA